MWVLVSGLQDLGCITLKEIGGSQSLPLICFLPMKWAALSHPVLTMWCCLATGPKAVVQKITDCELWAKTKMFSFCVMHSICYNDRKLTQTMENLGESVVYLIELQYFCYMLTFDECVVIMISRSWVKDMQNSLMIFSTLLLICNYF
jgi:hypothetical protein